MAKKVNGPLKTPRSKPVGVTFYFIREGYNEPEMDDIFQESLPQSIVDRYKEEKVLWYLLDYIQKRPSPDAESYLTEKLNNESWVKSIETVQVHICEFNGPLNSDLKANLIADIKQIQYEELDEILDNFFRDHDMDEWDSSKKVEYLKKYLELRL